MQDLTHHLRTHAVLYDDNGILPLYVRVHLSPAEGEWDVRGVEYYTTREHAIAGGHEGFVMAPDDFNALPRSTQLALYGALNAWDDERRQRIHELIVGSMRDGTMPIEVVRAAADLVS